MPTIKAATAATCKRRCRRRDSTVVQTMTDVICALSLSPSPLHIRSDPLYRSRSLSLSMRTNCNRGHHYCSINLSLHISLGCPSLFLMSHLMPQPKIKLHSLGPLLLAFGPHVAVHRRPIITVLPTARPVAPAARLPLALRNNLVHRLDHRCRNRSARQWLDHRCRASHGDGFRVRLAISEVRSFAGREICKNGHSDTVRKRLTNNYKLCFRSPKLPAHTVHIGSCSADWNRNETHVSRPARRCPGGGGGLTG